MLIRMLLLVFEYLWPSPWTAIGLAIAALLPWKSRTMLFRNGVIAIYGPSIAWVLKKVPIPGGAAAITFGHVILARDKLCMEESFAHEMVHVRQYVWWGPFFVPAYFFNSLWQMCLGRDPYLWNAFERQARQCCPEPRGKTNSESCGCNGCADNEVS